MATSSTAVAEFDNIIKDYPSGLLGRKFVRAVAGLSLTIEPGEVFGLLGPNRAGKTTLVKLLLSLCRPTSGSARRFGRPLSDRRTLSRIGYVHENQALPRYLTASGLLQYYGALSLVRYETVRNRVPKLLEQVGLADRSQEPIVRFSKGMVQRLAVAQAMINDPELLVFDEPNEGLDLSGRELVAELIRGQRRRGRSVLLVSHVLSEVEQLCDRVAVLVGGRLVHLGSLSGLTHDAASGTTRSLEQALQKLYKKSNA